MYGVRHHLTEDFPDMSEAINELNNESQKFARLLTAYDETDKKIYGIEVKQHLMPTDYVGMLKKQRINLKDKLYTILAHSVNKQ